VPLLPLTAAFFAGRLVSYSAYVGAALQVAMLAGLVLLVRVDWAARLTDRR
jgi:hypothetical protein